MKRGPGVVGERFDVVVVMQAVELPICKAKPESHEVRQIVCDILYITLN